MATYPLLAPGTQSSARIWGKAAKEQEFVGQLGTGKGCVTQVFPTVPSKLATTVSAAAQATGQDGLPAPAEGASLNPGWHGNETGGDWSQQDYAVLRTERQGQAREVLAMLSASSSTATTWASQS